MHQMRRPDFKVFMSGDELYHARKIRLRTPLNQLSATLRKWYLTGLIFEGDHPSFLGNGYRLDL